MNVEQFPESADVGLLSPVRAGTVAERVTSDGAFVRAMLDAEAALARALARAGLLPQVDAEVIAGCAAAQRVDVRALAERARGGGNPVIGLVGELRAAVQRQRETAARWVHHGATSQDILDTAAMLVAATVLDGVEVDLHRTAGTAARLARTHRDTVLAARTLGQHAVPTTFGRVVAGWLTGLLDAAERIRATRERLPVQLGGAAGTLASLGDAGPAVAAEYAVECGLAAPQLPWHTVRTPIVDLAAVLAHVAVACGKMATDVADLTRTEVGEVSESSAGGSSAMPHKRNPIRATMVLAAARQLPALTATLHQAAVAPHERPTGEWHAEWQPFREALRLAGGAAATSAELLEDLQVHTDRIQANVDLTGGLLVSERVAVALTPIFGPTAHQRVRDLALRATEQRRTLADVLAADREVVDALGATLLRELCDPAGYTGSAGTFVDRVLARHEHTERQRAGWSSASSESAADSRDAPGEGET